jgi:hypothetical protein
LHELRIKGSWRSMELMSFSKNESRAHKINNNDLSFIMRQKRLKLGEVLFLGLGITGLKAQEAITPSGGNASGGAGTISYSVGQIVYQTNIGTSGFIVEGVQQPYDISVVTSIEEAKGINLSISAYPNPANDFITLTVENIEISNLQYQLYNLNGIQLLNGEITGNLMSIGIGHLVPAIYYVKVAQKGREVITFKIIKK